MTRNEVLKNLKGVIVPVVTPFNRRGDVDEKRLRENLSRYVGIGLSGILVGGSTGEAPYLADRERLRLVEIARDIVKAPEVLMAGTGLDSTSATIELSREAVKRGADVLLVLTPNYYKKYMNAEALTAHYKKVGSSVKPPVMIYSIPQFTGLDVDPATIGKLSQLPNIVGLKESSGRLPFVGEVVKKARKGFKVMVGSASIFYDALGNGAAGAVLGMANYAPALCVALYQAFIERQEAQAKDLQQRLESLTQKINNPYGIAGIKAALDLGGFSGGTPRLPLIEVSGKVKKQIALALREAHEGLTV